MKRKKNFFVGIVGLALVVFFAANAVAGNTSATFRDFAIVGDTSVVIGGGLDLIPGSGQARVGSNGALKLGTNVMVGDTTNGGNLQAIADMIIGGGTLIYGDVTTNGNLKIGTNATIGGDCDAGGNFVLGGGSDIGGDVNVGGVLTRGTNTTIGGVEGSSPEAAPMIALPACEAECPGGDNFTAGTNSGPHTLLPGAYGSYVFGGGSKVVFTTGSYSFQNLKFGTNVKIAIEAPVTINVCGSLIIGGGTKEDLTSGGAEDVIYLIAEGGSANVGTNTRLYGTFSGPGADVTIGGGTDLNGAIYAYSVKLGTNVKMVSSPADACPDATGVGIFVLLANGIKLGGGTHVISGDVGTTGNLLTGTNVIIDTNINTISRVIASSANLGGGSHLDYLATDGYTIGTNVIIGAVESYAAGNLPLSANWPTAGTCSAGSNDVIEGTNATVTIPPGAYDQINIGGGSEVTLEGGLYQVNSFTLGTNCKVFAQGPTTICVNGTINIGGGSKINDPNGDFHVSPQELLFKGSGTVTTGTNVLFYGAITASPGGTISLGGGGNYFGAYVANAIICGTNCDFTLASPFGM